MTVTTTSMQENTKIITIKDETSYATIYSAINAAIVSLGWTLVDSLDNVIPGTGETSVYSPMFLRVYSAPNIDGTTYKYFILRLNYQKMIFWTSTCEYWDSKLHVASNEAWNGSGSFMQHYDIIDSYIIINGTSRHLVIWPFIVGEPDLWTGVFEFERNALDFKSSCCFAWTNSVIIGTQYGIAQTAAGDGVINFSFPRTQDGVTGSAAATAYAAQAASSTYPPVYPSAFVTGTDTNKGYLGSIHFAANAWSKQLPFSAGSKAFEKTTLYPIALRHKSSDRTFGKAYNLSVGDPSREIGTVTKMPLDNVGGWASDSGTLSPTLSFPINGGIETLTGTWASSSTQNSGQDKLSKQFVHSNVYGNVHNVIMVGDYAYYTGTYGLFRVKLSESIASLGAKGNSAEFLYRDKSVTSATGFSTCADLIHDGGSYIYFTINPGSATRVGRLDIFTLSIITKDLPLMYSGGHGVGRISLDTQNLYIGGYNGSLAPAFAIVPINDFANGVITHVSQYLLSGVLTAFPNLLGGITLNTIIPSYSGWVTVCSGPASINTITLSIYSIDVKKGYAVYTASSVNATSANIGFYTSGSTNISRVMFADYCSGRLWLAQTNGTSSNASSELSEVHPNWFRDGTLSGMSTSRYSFAPTARGAGADVIGYNGSAGDPQITFIRGIMFMNKRGVCNYYLILSNPLTTSGTPTYLGENTVDVATGAGTPGEMFGSGILSLYTNGPRIAYTRSLNGVNTATVNFHNNVYGSSNNSGGSTARLFVKA